MEEKKIILTEEEKQTRFEQYNNRTHVIGRIVCIITLILLTAAASALAMAGFTFLAEKKKMEWLDNFSIAGSMLIGMVAAALAAGL